MKEVTKETRQKLHDTHVKLAQSPERLAFLRRIASDPANKAKRAEAMKKLWADPAYREAALSRMAANREAKAKAKAEAEADRTTPAEKAAAEANEAKAAAPVVTEALTEALTEAVTEAVARTETEAEALEKTGEALAKMKKRVVTNEQKAKYAANRKAKRAAAKS